MKKQNRNERILCFLGWYSTPPLVKSYAVPIDDLYDFDSKISICHKQRNNVNDDIFIHIV